MSSEELVITDLLIVNHVSNLLEIEPVSALVMQRLWNDRRQLLDAANTIAMWDMRSSRALTAEDAKKLAADVLEAIGCPIPVEL